MKSLDRRQRTDQGNLVAFTQKLPSRGPQFDPLLFNHNPRCKLVIQEMVFNPIPPAKRYALMNVGRRTPLLLARHHPRRKSFTFYYTRGERRPRSLRPPWIFRCGGTEGFPQYNGHPTIINPIDVSVTAYIWANAAFFACLRASTESLTSVE